MERHLVEQQVELPGLSNTDEQNGTAISLRQQRTITALISRPTIELAAQHAEVGRTTVYAWMSDPNFLAALKAAQHEQTRETLAYLRSCTLRAAQKLAELLNSQHEGTAYRAAVSLLDYGLKAAEFQELEERIQVLEERDRGI